MIPVDQTRFGGADAPPDERGDCYSACIASLLEVPLSDVPHFVAAGDDAAFQAALERWTRTRGFVLLCCQAVDGWELPAGVLGIASGDGPRGHKHAVVWRGGEGMVHDPHPSRAGLTKIDVFEMFFALDPGRSFAQTSGGLVGAEARLQHEQDVWADAIGQMPGVSLELGIAIIQRANRLRDERAASNGESMKPEIGQVWIDCDHRMDGRRVEVVKVSDGYVWVKNLPPRRARTTRISRQKFQPPWFKPEDAERARRTFLQAVSGRRRRRARRRHTCCYYGMTPKEAQRVTLQQLASGRTIREAVSSYDWRTAVYIVWTLSHAGLIECVAGNVVITNAGRAAIGLPSPAPPSPPTEPEAPAFTPRNCQWCGKRPAQSRIEYRGEFFCSEACKGGRFWRSQHYPSSGVTTGRAAHGAGPWKRV